ncbi:DEAD/DEAH box helicase [Methylovulum psychrotolerans]|uniref:RNA polymerase-associated protein RapA n=1 Tax=Methylovulum psychrotolerans TaxID=1704499 RepID=A0A2S5CIZ6_9GAMM|nr:DEAD/DEAH box helicase [Methylovulum psychrotolerans]POZ50727.1 RNA polymerase-associated protein RapA [Methylovulum psychrotolerans]
MPHSIIAPGTRIELRDEEWLVRRVDMTTSGGQQLTCIGLSELVKDKEALFLTELDNNSKFRTRINVLKPEDTEFVQDQSNGFIDSRLYLEALLRESPPTDNKLYVGHRAAMDVVPYQMQPTLQALNQPRQRILIADAVGLGKTLEAGILVSELMRRGKGKRILVVAVKSMLTQFQKEFWNRFTIPLTRLDSIGIQRVRNQIPSNHNPFFYFDKAIVSVDTLKQGIEYRNYLENAYWDIIVIDEAHNVAERSGSSQRARLARLLSVRSDTLIMLSATPHDGRAKSFASLLNMLDATAIANPENYSKDDYADKGLVIRRFKKDIIDQVKTEFKERKTQQIKTQASALEQAAFDYLTEIQFAKIDQVRSAGILFKTTLIKALFSSPVACRETIQNRLKNLEQKQDNAYQNDRDQLITLNDLLAKIEVANFSKYQCLIATITDHKEGLNWKPNETKDRIVIFTERIETLRFLKENLQQDLKLKDNQIEVLYGSLSDTEQQRIVEDFGQENKPVRLLICSDVASEGINLHFLSHRMIHFDIPWSLMIFQQRNGRIDRYGQEYSPHILYLMTDCANDVIKGDNRILEVLIEKDDQAIKNIGDPSVFMGVYDSEAEEQITAQAIENGIAAAAFDQQLESKAQAFDLFAEDWFATESQAVINDPLNETGSIPCLFLSDFDYLSKGIQRLAEKETRDRITQFSANPIQQRVEFTAPKSLELRFKHLSKEIWPSNGHFILSAEKSAIETAINESRQSEQSWPVVHYLWEQHPVFQWLNNKVAGGFKRQQAPVIVAGAKLAKGEVIYITYSLIANQKGQPLIQRWLGIGFINGQFNGIDALEEVLKRIGLSQGLPNSGEASSVFNQLAAQLPEVVKQTKQQMTLYRKAFEQENRPKLDAQLEKLKILENKHVEQLDLSVQTSEQLAAIKDKRYQEEKAAIRSRFEEYRQWIQETMNTEDHPYIQIVAAIVQA